MRKCERKEMMSMQEKDWPCASSGEAGCNTVDAIVALFAVALVASVAAQLPGNCSTGPTCPFSAPFEAVSITTDGTYRYVTTTGCPPYNNPLWHTPNAACKAQPPIVFQLPLRPVYAAQPIPVGEQASVYKGITYLKNSPAPQLGVLGVFLNGVRIFGFGSPCGFSSTCPATDASAPTNYVDAVQSEGRTTDYCGGHADPMSHYHIHSGLGIGNATQRAACNLPADVAGNHSELLGWMIDGFAMYGRYSLGGQVPTQLDACHGHTHDISGVPTYHYHLPDAFPWTIGCFKGCPLVANNMAFNSLDSSYKCPAGLSTDPSPVYEMIGTGSQSGLAATASLILTVVCITIRVI
eukprot:Em0005g1448a